MWPQQTPTANSNSGGRGVTAGPGEVWITGDGKLRGQGLYENTRKRQKRLPKAQLVSVRLVVERKWLVRKNNKIPTGLSTALAQHVRIHMNVWAKTESDMLYCKLFNIEGAG